MPSFPTTIAITPLSAIETAVTPPRGLSGWGALTLVSAVQPVRLH